jgi:hypothetical protein
MTEKEWVDSNLSGRTWGWEELLTDRVNTNDLDYGQLKQLIDNYLDAKLVLEEYLNILGYEAG